MNTKPNFPSKILRTTLTLAAMVTLLFAAPTKTWSLDRLKLVDNQLCNASGTPIQLRGWSTFRLKDESAAYQKEHLQKTKEMGANVVRCVVYVEGEDSYTYKNDQDGTTSQVKTWIDQCAEIGLYCLVDWRVEVPGNPNDWAYNGAENFFREITSYVKSKQYQHVLYEICDQPNGCTWTDIKQYANKVLPIISQNDPGSVVIVGTQQWCTLLDDYNPEDPDEPDYHDGPVSKPITGYNNLYIMYSFHYYTEASKDIIDRLSAAADDIPLFVTEWGFSDNKDIDTSVTDELLAVCNGQNDGGQFISWCNWALCETDHPYSALTSVSSFTLSSSGEYVVSMLKKKEMEDIAIYPADGDNISEVLATKVQAVVSANKMVRDIVVYLTAGAHYTMTSPIVPAGNFGILTVGDGIATIDASALSGPLVQMSDEPAIPADVNGFYPVNDVGFIDVKVTGLKDNLFYANKTKYSISNFFLQNCIIEVDGGIKTIINTVGGGVIGNLKIDKSTIASPTTAHTGALYNSQSGQKATEAGFVLQVFQFTNSTFYNIAYGKNFMNHRQPGTAWLVFEARNNIFVNCGKSGKTVIGMDGGIASSFPAWTISGNVFNFDGVDTSTAESTGDSQEPVENSIAGVLRFTDLSTGYNAQLGMLTDPATTTVEVGDSKWTVTTKRIYPIAGAVPYVVATMTDGWTIGNGVQAFLPKSYEAGASEITLTPLAGAPQGKVVILGNATDGAVLPDQIIPVPAPADETAVEESYTAALGQMDTKHFAITDGSKTLGDVIANDNTGVTASNAIVMVLKGGTFKAVDISEGDLKQNAKPGLLLFILSKWEYLNVGSNDNAGGAGSRGIGIGEGGATAIEKSHLIIDNSAGVWYDLQGRRMQGQPTRKGIYVRNCKKIVIR